MSNPNSRTELRYQAINLALGYRSVLSVEEFVSAMNNASSVYPKSDDTALPLEEVVFKGVMVGGFSEVSKRFELDQLKKRILTNDSIPVAIRVFYCDNVIVNDNDPKHVLDELNQFESHK